MEEIDIRFKGTEEELNIILDRLDATLLNLEAEWEIVER